MVKTVLQQLNIRFSETVECEVQILQILRGSKSKEVWPVGISFLDLELVLEAIVGSDASIEVDVFETALELGF